MLVGNVRSQKFDARFFAKMLHLIKTEGKFLSKKTILEYMSLCLFMTCCNKECIDCWGIEGHVRTMTAKKSFRQFIFLSMEFCKNNHI